mgnify:CR=1 FL=1
MEALVAFLGVLGGVTKGSYLPSTIVMEALSCTLDALNNDFRLSVSTSSNILIMVSHLL